jgi:hypothetical protein
MGIRGDIHEQKQVITTLDADLQKQNAAMNILNADNRKDEQA